MITDIKEVNKLIKKNGKADYILYYPGYHFGWLMWDDGDCAYCVTAKITKSLLKQYDNTEGKSITQFIYSLK